MILEPIWTALFASIWFAETMSVSQLFGCALIFSALLVSRWQWCRKILSRLGGKKYLQDQ
jgi:drug/metabolite transporter (DMT)-like permease